MSLWLFRPFNTTTQAVRWGVNAILTDVTKDFLLLKGELEGTHCLRFYPATGTHRTTFTVDYAKVSSTSRLFLWTRLDYYTIFQFLQWTSEHNYLQKAGGRFQKVIPGVPEGAAAVAVQ